MGGDNALTYERVRRASPSVATLFKWCTSELITVGALEPTEETAESDEQGDDDEICAIPDFTGLLAGLPSKEHVVESHRVLFLAMAGRTKDAEALAGALDTRGPCDRCDGPHQAVDCPHFGPHKGHLAWTPRRRGREDHEDALEMLDKATGDVAGGVLGRDRVHGRVVRQPGDGTCLFHSLSHGLNQNSSDAKSALVGPELRREIASYLNAHADDTVQGTTFRDYIWWDHQLSVKDYVKRMQRDGIWGGAIEIAACARMRGVNVHVYVEDPKEDNFFLRAATFGEDSSKQTISVSYMLRCHYDALVIGEAM